MNVPKFERLARWQRNLPVGQGRSLGCGVVGELPELAVPGIEVGEPHGHPSEGRIPIVDDGQLVLGDLGAVALGPLRDDLV